VNTAAPVQMPVPARGWRRVLAEPMFGTAANLMTNTVLTNGLGVLFWIAAARLYDPSAVGQGSALVSLMIALSSIGQLDLQNIGLRFLPAVERRAKVVATAYAVAVIFSGLIALVVLLGASHLSTSLRFLSQDRTLGLALVGAAALWSIFSIQDSVLTALGKARWVPIENAAFGVLKLGLLALFAGLGLRQGIFFAFAVPMALLLIPVNALVFGSAIPAAPRPTRAAVQAATFRRRRLLSFLAQDYAGSMLVQAGLTVVPLMVIAILGSRSNAFFYLPLLIVSAFDALFMNACASLVVAGSADVARQRELARLMARRALVLLIPGSLLLVLLAPYLLLVFGHDYAAHATTLMRLLALASIPKAAAALYAALARFTGDGRAILSRQLVSVGTLIIGTALLASPLGLTGVGLAWLGASLLVFATVARPLARILR